MAHNRMLQPLKKAVLRRQLASHLYDAIMRGQLRAGERVVEGRLAKDLGVSQGTLREALQVLEHEGLITKYDHHGSYVTQLTAREIEDIYAVRLALEPLAAELARKRMTAEGVAQLTVIFDQMQRAGDSRDFVDLLKCDLAFHRLLWKLSGNRALERALNAVCPPLFGCYLLLVPNGEPYNPAKDLDEHRLLLGVLEKGTADEVRRVFRQTIEVFRQQEISNLVDRGQAAADAASFPRSGRSAARSA